MNSASSENSQDTDANKLQNEPPANDTDSVKQYRAAGYHPIINYGVTDEWHCTCKKGADCGGPGKHPIGTDWQRSGPAEFHPAGTNIGLRMGLQPSGINLIALDEDEPGAIAKLEQEHGKLPPTLTQRSGSGGQHRVFRCDAPLGNRGKLKALKLDVRGKGGQIIVAPSRHASGGTYEWIRVVPVAQLPDAWVELISDKGAKPGSSALANTNFDDRRLLDSPKLKCPADADPEQWAIGHCKRATPAVQGDRGHDHLLTLLTDLIIGFKLERETASDIAAEHYNPRCIPEFEVGSPEWEHKLDEAEANHLGRTPGDLVKPGVEFTDQEILERSVGPQGNWLTDPDAINRLAQLDTAAREHVYNEIKGLGCRVMTPLRKAVTAAERRLARERGQRGLADLRVTEAGKVEPSMFNLACILRDSPRFRGRVQYDDFRACALIDGEPLTERTLQNTCIEIEDEFPMQAADSLVYKVLKSDAVPHVHPVREYLLGLPAWDGNPWLSFLPEMFTCEPTDLNMAMFRAWMIGAVARVFEPGCQMDYVLTLQGAEGIGKSGGFRRLIGQDWFHSSKIDLESKDASTGLAGTWCWELCELEGLSKYSWNRWKQFLTDPIDKVRAAYAHVAESVPRQTVFCASTNDEDFLPQGEDGRRFWVMRCNGPRINWDALVAARDQLWAEALAAYRNGEKAMLPANLEVQARDCRGDFKFQDAWTQPIADWLTQQRCAEANGVTPQAALHGAIRVDLERQDRRTVERAKRVLKALGWHRASARDNRQARVRLNGSRCPLYYPPKDWVFAKSTPAVQTPSRFAGKP